VETWITSDGKLYFVRLLENTVSDTSTSDISGLVGGGYKVN
jgi:hypothetical protein